MDSDYSVGDAVRVIDEKAARITGKAQGAIGKVQMNSMRSRRFVWVMFEDGAMCPFDRHEIELASKRYEHLWAAA